MTHTKTPWRVANECAYGWDIRTADESDVWIASVNNSHKGHVNFPEKEHAEENAAFIVRACNSHEQLLEACKAAYAAFHGTAVVPATCEAMDKLEAAIAQAESSSPSHL